MCKPLKDIKFHPGLTIMDDIIESSGPISEEIREKVREWFKRDDIKALKKLIKTYHFRISGEEMKKALNNTKKKS